MVLEKHISLQDISKQKKYGIQNFRQLCSLRYLH